MVVESFNLTTPSYVRIGNIGAKTSKFMCDEWEIEKDFFIHLLQNMQKSR